MHSLQLFLPCAAGVEPWLAQEVSRVVGRTVQPGRSGVTLEASWREALQLNLHSRLAQRVMAQVWVGGYRTEDDVYEAAAAVPWEMWMTAHHTFKVDVTAHQCPFKSLNFAALRVKDGVVDRLRHKTGARPNVDTARPQVRVMAHLAADRLWLYMDTSGEPLFKRGWREDKGDAPLKETLAAAMLAAAGWDGTDSSVPLYDPCCGSGTIAIEAAEIALGLPPGRFRRFGFERLLPFQAHVWASIKNEAQTACGASDGWQKDLKNQPIRVFGSDVAHRMVDFAQRNAERAGVAHAIEFRGGDALQRMPPSDRPGVMLLNPPYGERIAAAGVAGVRAADRAQAAPRAARVFRPGDSAPAVPVAMGREQAQTDTGGDDFFPRLAAHWKRNYAGWTAWMLTPDMKLPTHMRLKESRRVPMWNGPIECRLFRFDLVAGSARGPRSQGQAEANTDNPADAASAGASE